MEHSETRRTASPKAEQPGFSRGPHFSHSFYEKKQEDFKMSKYDPLWKYIQENGTERFRLPAGKIKL